MIVNQCIICRKDFEIPNWRPNAICCSRSCQISFIWKGRKHKQETKEKMRKSPIWKRLDEFKELYYSGKTCKEISKISGENENTIKTIFRKIGMKMRPTTRRKGSENSCKGKPRFKTRGENNPRWKNGITSLNQQIRHCIEMKNWKQKIRERDNYTCLCGQKGGNNEVDHYPKKFSQILKDNNIKSLEDAQKCDELWNLDNGRTLCLKCHNKTKSSCSNKK